MEELLLLRAEAYSTRRQTCRTQSLFRHWAGNSADACTSHALEFVEVTVGDDEGDRAAKAGGGDAAQILRAPGECTAVEEDTERPDRSAGLDYESGDLLPESRAEGVAGERDSKSPGVAPPLRSMSQGDSSRTIYESADSRDLYCSEQNNSESSYNSHLRSNMYGISFNEDGLLVSGDEEDDEDVYQSQTPGEQFGVNRAKQLLHSLQNMKNVGTNFDFWA